MDLTDVIDIGNIHRLCGRLYGSTREQEDHLLASNCYIWIRMRRDGWQLDEELDGDVDGKIHDMVDD